MDASEFRAVMVPVKEPEQLLQALTRELALTLSLLEEADGQYVRAGKQNKNDAQTLTDWTTAAYMRFLDNYLDRAIDRMNTEYGFVQAHDDSCWAATAIVARRMKGETHWKNEVDFFASKALPLLPTKEQINEALKHIATVPNGRNYYLAQDLQQKGKPATNSQADRLEFFKTTPIEILEPAMRAKVITFEQKSEDELKEQYRWVREYLMIVNPDYMHADDQRVTLVRTREMEREYFSSVGLDYAEIPIKDFTEERLMSLMDSRCLIVSINCAAITAKGKALRTQLKNLEKNADLAYQSHFVVVLHASPMLRKVYILNTLPYMNGVFISAADNYTDQSQVVVLAVQDFIDAVVSDVRCLGKVILPDKNVPQLSSSEKETIPIVSFSYGG